VKNLVIFLLLLALVGLGFHDKQQSDDLAKAQQDNALLTQQLSEKGTQRTRASQPIKSTLSGAWSLQTSSLDRGPYKDVSQ